MYIVVTIPASYLNASFQKEMLNNKLNAHKRLTHVAGVNLTCLMNRYYSTIVISAGAVLGDRHYPLRHLVTGEPFF